MAIEVGQKVWILLREHPARKAAINEGVVVKVGRKYVYVDYNGFLEHKFDLETMIQSTEYAYKAKLYLSEQAYKDDLEYHENLKRIRDLFGRYVVPKINLDQSRRILAILNED